MVFKLGTVVTNRIKCSLTTVSRRWETLTMHPAEASWERTREVVDEIIGRHALRRETTTREFVSIVNDLVLQAEAMTSARRSDRRLTAAIQWILSELEREDGPVFLSTFTDMDHLIEACAKLKGFKILQEDDIYRMLKALSHRMQQKEFIQRASPRAIYWTLELSKTCWHPPTMNAIIARLQSEDPGLFKDSASGTYASKIFTLLTEGHSPYLGDRDRNRIGDISLHFAMKRFEALVQKGKFDFKQVATICSIMRARKSIDFRFMNMLERDVLCHETNAVSWAKAGTQYQRADVAHCISQMPGSLPPNMFRYLDNVCLHAFRGGNYSPADCWSTSRFGPLLQLLLDKAVVTAAHVSLIVTCIQRRCDAPHPDDKMPRLTSLTSLIRAVYLLRLEPEITETLVNKLHRTFFPRCHETGLMDICYYYKANKEIKDATAFDKGVRQSAIYNPKAAPIPPHTLVQCVLVSLLVNTQCKPMVHNHAISQDFVKYLDIGQLRSIITLLKHEEDNFPLMIYLRKNIGRVQDEDEFDE
eukprot:TRINITY_DN12704_c1_g1_i1.p1 TRINITY_DN12704_c1_g1~~TRINITY_DN12704_c1_g1_i1.p1  ORF type:complete len:530 (+),score=49.98 TRINITY_DN12704_c1_g1_i1:104-1693(+)